MKYVLKVITFVFNIIKKFLEYGFPIIVTLFLLIFKGTYQAVKYLGKFLRKLFHKNPFSGKISSQVYEKTVTPSLDKGAYKLNGALGYKKGSNPTVGSIRYTIIRIGLGLFAFNAFTLLIRLFL